MNTGVGSLSLLQGIFPTQESNWGLLHCRWILLPAELPGKSRQTVAAAAKSLQSCPTLCDPRDSSPPGSPVPGILQARTLEWVAISFSSAWKWKVKVKLLSRVRLLATPWTAAYQALPSMGFSRQEYWSGVPLPSPRQTVSGLLFFLPGDLPDPGIKPASLVWRLFSLTGGLFTTEPPGNHFYTMLQLLRTEAYSWRWPYNCIEHLHAFSIFNKLVEGKFCDGKEK